MDERTLTVGVVGATGHGGGELCRLLLGHPAVGRVVPAAREAQDLEPVHPNLTGSELVATTLDDLAARASELDVVFFSTPSGTAMRLAGSYLDAGVRVVDLSADFRFPDPDEYQRVHEIEHTAPDLLREAVYGATELFRADIASARLVANPGCYAIAATLALDPFAGLLDPSASVVVHAVNGTTGAGTTARRPLMHAEMASTMLAYDLEGHRHGPELGGLLGWRSGTPIIVDMNTSHGPFARGIHLQANVRLIRDLDRDALLAILLERYGVGHKGEYFVQVTARAKDPGRNAKQYEAYPTMAEVVGSNFCHLGVDRDEVGVVKVLSVIDNLIKGAAGSAIQNMNVMLGLDETLGLRAYAL